MDDAMTGRTGATACTGWRAHLALRGALLLCVLPGLGCGAALGHGETAATLRLEAREAAAAGDRGAAARAYHRAAAAGDPDARFEEAIWRAGGSPAWIDDLSEAARTGLEHELDEVNATAGRPRAFYAAGGIGLGVGAVLAAGGALNGLRSICFGGFGGPPCPPPPDYGVSTALYVAGASVGALGLVLLLVGAGHDVDSGARRNAWRDSVSAARTPGGPITLRLSIGDGPTLGVTGSF